MTTDNADGEGWGKAWQTGSICECCVGNDYRQQKRSVDSENKRVSRFLAGRRDGDQQNERR